MTQSIANSTPPSSQDGTEDAENSVKQQAANAPARKQNAESAAKHQTAGTPEKKNQADNPKPPKNRTPTTLKIARALELIISKYKTAGLLKTALVEEVEEAKRATEGELCTEAHIPVKCSTGDPWSGPESTYAVFTVHLIPESPTYVSTKKNINHSGIPQQIK